MHYKPSWGATVLALVVTMSGCSTLTANNGELLTARTELSAGNVKNALAAVDPTKRDDLPAILDRAVIYQIQGLPRESNAEFDRAIVQIRDYENRATVSATEVGTGAVSLLLNDKVLEYQGEGFEKVLVHALKARNYLALGDEEAARVEIRNANMRQDEERKRNADTMEKAKKDANGRVNMDGLSQEIDKQFAPSADILLRLDNVYQNPFATYLSGVVYELNGEPDDAFIDFKKVYETTRSPVVEPDLIQLGSKLRRKSELAQLGLEAPKGAPPAPGNTIVLVDNGLAPERVEIKFPIPGPNTVLFAAVPMTKPVATDVGDVEVLDGQGQVIGRTAPMVDIEAMAVRNLRDKYPAILVRQAVRLAAKAAAGYAIEKEAGTLGLVATSLLNAATEQADLRGWYALPRSIHVAKVALPAGQREVTLRLLAPTGQPLREVTVPVQVANPRLNLVSVRYVGGQVFSSVPGPTEVAEGQR